MGQVSKPANMSRGLLVLNIPFERTMPPGIPPKSFVACSAHRFAGLYSQGWCAEDRVPNGLLRSIPRFDVLFVGYREFGEKFIRFLS